MSGSKMSYREEPLVDKPLHFI